MKKMHRTILTTSLLIALITAATSLAQQHREQAIETRPLWERPPDRVTPWERTESALDRGTGRITDEQTHQLDRIRAERLFEQGRLSETDIFEAERDRDLRLEQQNQRTAQRDTRQRKLEYESDVLRDERERFFRRLEIEQREGPNASATQPTSRESQRSTTKPSRPSPPDSRPRLRGNDE